MTRRTPEADIQRAIGRPMSHHAPNCAIQQRGLKPATKIVVWHLCDRHNPDFGCFPTQAHLAADCEISRSTLNDHLGKLEAAGLARRCPSVGQVTKRQQPTRYILGFEDGFDALQSRAASGFWTWHPRRIFERDGGRRMRHSAVRYSNATYGNRARSRVRISSKAVSGK